MLKFSFLFSSYLFSLLYTRLLLLTSMLGTPQRNAVTRVLTSYIQINTAYLIRQGKMPIHKLRNTHTRNIPTFI